MLYAIDFSPPTQPPSTTSTTIAGSVQPVARLESRAKVSVFLMPIRSLNAIQAERSHERCDRVFLRAGGPSESSSKSSSATAAAAAASAAAALAFPRFEDDGGGGVAAAAADALRGVRSRTASCGGFSAGAAAAAAAAPPWPALPFLGVAAVSAAAVAAGSSLSFFVHETEEEEKMRSLEVMLEPASPALAVVARHPLIALPYLNPVTCNNVNGRRVDDILQHGNTAAEERIRRQ